MSQLTPELRQILAATALRLRLIQTDLADEPPEVRQDQITQYISSVLRQMLAADRPRFLAELREEFPAWESGLSLADVPQTMQPETDRRELDDPSFLAERLGALSPDMPDDVRAAVLGHLQQAGLVPLPRDGPSDAQIDALLTRLQLPRGVGLDQGRALETMGLLLDFVLAMEQLTLESWKAFGVGAAAGTAPTLARSVRRYLSGDPELNRTQLTQEIARLRQNAASIIAAMPHAARQQWRAILARLSPDAIEFAASRDRGGLLESPQAKAWRKYRELLATMDDAMADSEFRKALTALAADFRRA